MRNLDSNFNDTKQEEGNLEMSDAKKNEIKETFKEGSPDWSVFSTYVQKYFQTTSGEHPVGNPKELSDIPPGTISDKIFLAQLDMMTNLNGKNENNQNLSLDGVMNRAFVDAYVSHNTGKGSNQGIGSKDNRTESITDRGGGERIDYDFSHSIPLKNTGRPLSLDMSGYTTGTKGNRAEQYTDIGAGMYISDANLGTVGLDYTKELGAMITGAKEIAFGTNTIYISGGKGLTNNMLTSTVGYEKMLKNGTLGVEGRIVKDALTSYALNAKYTVENIKNKGSTQIFAGIEGSGGLPPTTGYIGIKKTF